MMIFRSKTNIDESLDVWAVHGMGGTWGAIATGIFCTTAVNAAGKQGLIYGNPKQVLIQLIGVVAVWVFAFGMTWIIGKFVDKVIGLRVSAAEESVGLDISQHGERAYGGNLR
jgi:Amt family ammonium transporter